MADSISTSDTAHDVNDAASHKNSTSISASTSPSTSLSTTDDVKDVDDVDLAELYDFAVQLAKDAGQLLIDAAEARRQNFNNPTNLQSAEKLNSVDLVTSLDLSLEYFLQTSISTRYPHHAFLGEESYSAGESRQYLVKPESPPTWCIDPLDGTINYLHLFPMVCISISLLVRGVPVIGVINAPLLPSLFSARLGGGAWLNETTPLPLLQPPPPLPQGAPKGCIFSCEWGKDRRDIPSGNLYRKSETFLNMATELGGRGGKGGMAHGIRSLGSAALDLAYTATGAFDIWWEGGCWEWDVAAGVCILREAGGLVTNGAPPEGYAEGPDEPTVEELRLGGRRYLGIRAAGDREGETGREQQERLVKEVWKRVVPLDYSRPGG
ncbi:inositol monophosphatase family-domain-containing protein [Pyronema domesticum]|uniref:Inositol-1-monophosphatase n=1 Tax=Pyronema omphalodes (strain CBS 100304) TaxID=1076935 RepID=U4LUF2_PYROM|nr:inositol monophosphatase family-domain-containing protein [Pyronema domesticum]CCX31606.1 Similar to Protein QA-X; acc. no. P11634 [Pyronema omphalodes CBS 100304]